MMIDNLNTSLEKMSDDSVDLGNNADDEINKWHAQLVEMGLIKK